MPALQLLLLQLGLVVPAFAVKGDGGPPGTEDYFWPKRAGTYIGHGHVPYVLPTSFFSRKPAWTWDNPDDELFRHGPVIDQKKSIYAVTAPGWIRKFSPDGALLWSSRFTPEEGKTVTSPFLYKGQLFLTSMGPGSSGYGGHAHCFDMETGSRLWVSPLPTTGHVNHDSSTVHAAEGVLLGAMTSIAAPQPYEGNNLVWAMNATDGKGLWEFIIEGGVVWNFMPSTPGDGTFFFSSNCGVAERRRLADGSLVWRSSLKTPGHWCSTGGGTLGPNGVFYVEANHGYLSLMEGVGEPPVPGSTPCSFFGCPKGSGIFIAHRAEDGEVLWSRRIWMDGISFGGMQYPAVGKIGDRLVLAAGVGTNPALAEFTMGEKFLPVFLRVRIAQYQVKWAWLRSLLGIPIKRNAVVVLDAGTGEDIFRWEEEPWDKFAAKGDEEPMFARVEKLLVDRRLDHICGPDNWGIPAITADGTVLIGSGSTGKLYALRDANGDGSIQDGEVFTFDTEQAFLNGPALAPGLMAVAPCWGKMYVFKSDTE